MCISRPFSPSPISEDSCISNFDSYVVPPRYKTSSTVINFFLLSLALFSVPSISASQTPNTKPHPFILSIKKDPETNLFYTSVGVGTPRHNFNLVIDLAGENLWYDCGNNYNSSTYLPIDCDSKLCPNTSFICEDCPAPLKTGCSKSICLVRADNPFANIFYDGGLSEDILFISQQQVSGLLSQCIDIESYGQWDNFTDGTPVIGLPKSAKGMISLSRSELVVPIQLAQVNKLPHKFSLCLPSSNKHGFTNLLVGAGKHPKEKELSKFLQTTPLVVNPFPTGPVSEDLKGIPIPSNEYFIDVKAVKIDGHVVDLKPSLLSIDNKGNAGTKISTMTPFTELQTSVYKPFIREFLKKALDRKLKRVASVAPFEACFDSTTIGNSATGLVVPTIDLVLQGGVQWTIHGANSMIMSKENVACLAFVDGGTKPPKRTIVKTSIVIGGYQLQDNLLVFDVASSKLSFSSSLLLHNATCSPSLLNVAGL